MPCTIRQHGKVIFLGLCLAAMGGGPIRGESPSTESPSARVATSQPDAPALTQSFDRLADSFRGRHQSLINALAILAVIIGLSYAVKLALWLIQQLLVAVRTRLPSRGFSVKRSATLLGFAGSIITLFIWIFGLMTILREFGIDPATSAGAIGLIGLILAGMFQQIVIDFVKGLDIIAGRHYNVGDFIEVGEKLGHVIDFNVKYTRLRTLSGQEYNVPNAQCVPSRRFPDGHVDNFVDLPLANNEAADRAETLLKPVCADLNQRIEALREKPAAVDRFSGLPGRVVLRYRLRVLPGCDWVVNDHFLPAARRALTEGGVELQADPTTFFMNHIPTFRKLFSRQLTEDEILSENKQSRITPSPSASESSGDPA